MNSQTDKLADYFKRHPNRRLAMPTLGREIGAWAVHSRVSQARKKFGMRIENIIKTVRGKRHSSYIYTP